MLDEYTVKHHRLYESPLRARETWHQLYTAYKIRGGDTNDLYDLLVDYDTLKRFYAQDEFIEAIFCFGEGLDITGLYLLNDVPDHETYINDIIESAAVYYSCVYRITKDGNDTIIKRVK